MGGGEDDALEGILARRTGAFGGACVGLFLLHAVLLPSDRKGFIA